MVFPVIMYGCESWTIKKAEHRRIAAFELWCWRRLLSEQGLSPYRTFDSISKFAELLSKSRGELFIPRITTHTITENTEIILIEPACGSNTAVIKSHGEFLCVDSGYACYREEMLEILHDCIPGFEAAHKRLLLTHADVDHCGLMDVFDEIIVSCK